VIEDLHIKLTRRLRLLNDTAVIALIWFDGHHMRESGL
jgi:hypothetical protein